jgi:hypothetical protein
MDPEFGVMNIYRRAAAAALALASAGALAAPPAQPIVIQGLDCRNDEASWRLDANRASAVFTTTAPRKREVIFRGSMQTLGASSVIWRGDSTHLPRETLVLTAHEEACKAQAAGTYRAVLSVRPNEASTGCCAIRAGYDARVAPLANLGAKDDWSRALPDLLAAINACVAREGARVHSVASAAPAEAQMVRVRLNETNGAVDCTVDANGRGAPTIAPAAAGAANGPLFYPAREPAPIVSCGRLERVQLRNNVAGYLHYEPC